MKPEIAAPHFLVILLLILLVAAISGFILTAVFSLIIIGVVLMVRWFMRKPAVLTPAQQSARRARRFATSFVMGWGFAMAHALAAIYILATLPHQAEAARANHDSPALGFLAPAFILLALASRRRQ